LIGISEEQYLGSTSIQATGHASVPEPVQAAHQALAGEPVGMLLEWVVRRRTGSPIWFGASLTRLDERRLRVNFTTLHDDGLVEDLMDTGQPPGVQGPQH
jgi:hypothetical protein